MTGTLTLQNSTNLDVGANAATVNALNINSGSRLLMQNAAGQLTVSGTIAWNTTGGWDETQLTAGTLRVRGNWNMSCSGSGAFNMGGTHLVVFDGTAAQTINSGCAGGTSSGQEHYRNLTVANTSAAVTFNGGYFATGTVTVNAGATASGGGTWTVAAGSLVNNGTYSVTNTTFSGTASTTALPTFTIPNLVLDGSHTFTLPASGFAVTGTLTLQNSTNLSVGANATTVNALNINSGSRLLMQNAAGQLTVSGTIAWNTAGGWDETQLTAGTLRVRGNWNMSCSGSGVFNSGGTHTVIFDGTAAQTVNSGCAGGTSSGQEHFHNLTIANTAATVTIGSTTFVKGLYSHNTGVTVSGGTLNLAGTHAFAAGVSTGTTAFVFNVASGTLQLPSVTLSQMTLDGAARFVAPGAGLSVTNALTAQNSAVFDADTAVSTVGSLTFNTGSRLRMKDSRATLTVNGAANFNATGVPYRDSSVTAGTLRISGTFNGGCGADVFNAAGSHILEAFGSSAQSLNPCATKGVDSTEFHLSELRVNKSAGTLSLGAVDVLGKLRLMSGTLSSATATAWDSLVVTGGTLTGGGITFRRTGQPIPPNTLGTVTLKADAWIGGGVSSGTIVADSGQLDVTGNATINGNISTTRIGTVRMLTAATLTVTGTANFAGASMSGLLKAGRLEVGSHFTQGSSSSTSFTADSAHVTVFNGTAFQNISMANPSESLAKFATLEVSNTSTGGVTFVTNATVIGNLIVPGTANDSVRFGQTGSSTLTVGGVNVSNTGNTRARFKGLRLVIKNFGLGSIAQFDGAVFETFNSAHNQLTFEYANAANHTFNNLTFRDSPPATGFYVVMNALSTTLNLMGTSPTLASNGGRTSVTAGTLNWTP